MPTPSPPPNSNTPYPPQTQRNATPLLSAYCRGWLIVLEESRWGAIDIWNWAEKRGKGTIGIIYVNSRASCRKGLTADDILGGGVSIAAYMLPLTVITG